MKTEAPEVVHDSAQEILNVVGLNVEFPSKAGSSVRAVDDVSFAVRSGQTLAIVGESGSGKSVTARAIMRLLPRQANVSGTMAFDHRDLSILTKGDLRSILGREISMVFQDSSTSLNPVVRIGKQITANLKLHLGLSGTEARLRAEELLARVGIPEPKRRLRNYPHEMSGGMRQRVCIALAISCAPRLLVADEPTTALDVTTQRQVLDLLDVMQDEGNTAVLLISHDLGVVAQRADHIAVMYAGQVVESGTATAIFHQTRHPYTAALLGSVPKMTDPPHTRLTGTSQVAGAGHAPGGGCCFAARCPIVESICLTEKPLLKTAENGLTAVRCHFPLSPPPVGAVKVPAHGQSTGERP